MAPGERLGLAGATVAALAIMLGLAWQVSIQLDEIFVRDLTRLPWDELWSRFSSDETNAAGWHLILAAWIRVSPDPGTLLLRLPAILCTVALVPAVWGTARRFNGAAAAQRAAWLVPAHPLVFRYGWEARSYAAVMLVATLLLLLWTYDRPWWFGLAAGTAIWVHVLLALVPVALLLTRRRDLWRVALAATPMAVIPLTWMATVERDVLWWLHSPTPVQWVTGLLLVVGGLGAPGFVAAWTRQRPSLRLAAIVPLALIILATLTWQPLWHLRYLVIAVPPLLVAAGTLSRRGAFLTAVGGISSWLLLLALPPEVVPSMLGSASH